MKFAHEKISEKTFLVGRDILQAYNSIPSKEIYDPELFRGFIREIRYYYSAHLFEDPSYALTLLKMLGKAVQHLKEQTAIGKKYIYDTQAPADGNKLEAYYNETLNSITSTYYKTADHEGLYIAHNIMNTLHTTDLEYVQDSLGVLEKQLDNSSVISEVNEKARNDYFHKIERSIEQVKRSIEADLDEDEI